MTTGILIIAVGAKGYGQLAGSLAASLRANNCTLPICLAHQKETITRLDEDYLALFTDFVEVKDEHITLNDNIECYIKAKAHMDELTPYDYTLFIDAEYSGGCKDHVFTARHNGNYMKSMPPQLNLYIDHQANADGCRELIRETIAFDLKNCKVGKTGTVILLINADRSKKVTYTY